MADLTKHLSYGKTGGGNTHYQETSSRRSKKERGDKTENEDSYAMLAKELLDKCSDPLLEPQKQVKEVFLQDKDIEKALDKFRNIEQDIPDLPKMTNSHHIVDMMQDWEESKTIFETNKSSLKTEDKRINKELTTILDEIEKITSKTAEPSKEEIRLIFENIGKAYRKLSKSKYKMLEDDTLSSLLDGMTKNTKDQSVPALEGHIKKLRQYLGSMEPFDDTFNRYNPNGNPGVSEEVIRELETINQEAIQSKISNYFPDYSIVTDLKKEVERHKKNIENQVTAQFSTVLAFIGSINDMKQSDMGIYEGGEISDEELYEGGDKEEQKEESHSSGKDSSYGNISSPDDSSTCGQSSKGPKLGGVSQIMQKNLKQSIYDSGEHEGNTNEEVKQEEPYQHPFSDKSKVTSDFRKSITNEEDTMLYKRSSRVGLDGIVDNSKNIMEPGLGVESESLLPQDNETKVQKTTISSTKGKAEKLRRQLEELKSMISASNIKETTSGNQDLTPLAGSSESSPTSEHLKL